MSRPIDADALRKAMYHEAFEVDEPNMTRWDGGCWIRYKLFEECLDSAPTVDAVYICDRKKCDNCNSLCVFTRDRTHAGTLEKALIIDGLSLTVKPQQWIPCSERLPEKEKKCYWVCTDDGYQFQCRWTNVFGFYESDDWTWSIFDKPQYSKIIAWMPLPEPYKGVE